MLRGCKANSLATYAYLQTWVGKSIRGSVDAISTMGKCLMRKTTKKTLCYTIGPIQAAPICLARGYYAIRRNA